MMINFLFVACSLYLLVQAFRLMSGAWNLNTPEIDPSKPIVTAEYLPTQSVDLSSRQNLTISLTTIVSVL